MDKLKTLLGRTNAQRLIGGAIAYGVGCLLIALVKPWWLAMIIYCGLIAPVIFLTMLSEMEDIVVKTIKADVIYALVWSIVSSMFKYGVIYALFRYIGWFTVPVGAVGTVILLMLIYEDDEPRTKTFPFNEEVEGNERSDLVACEAQDVPAGDDGPDPDGDSEDEETVGWDELAYESEKKSLAQKSAHIIENRSTNLAGGRTQ